MDDYYERLNKFNIINKPKWYKLLVKNTASGLLGMMGGGTIGLIFKFTGDYEDINKFVYSGVMTVIYDSIMLISPSNLIKRESLMAGKRKQRLVLEDNLGFYAGNALGYFLASFIPN